MLTKKNRMMLPIVFAAVLLGTAAASAQEQFENTDGTAPSHQDFVPGSGGGFSAPRAYVASGRNAFGAPYSSMARAPHHRGRADWRYERPRYR